MVPMWDAQALKCVCGGGGVLVVIGLEYTPNERGHI